MAKTSVLEIIAQGAWNGGIPVDNSVYLDRNMTFKGGIPVNNETIEERIGIRKRMAAPPEERIGITALEDLLANFDIDRSKVKLVIGATNVGDDKYDTRPLIRFAYDRLKNDCPEAVVFDLYAGCPGFNVAAELNFMLSMNGFLKEGDFSIIIGAENIHRANAFKPDDTSNIIFGDDALATALKTNGNLTSNGRYSSSERQEHVLETDFIKDIAKQIQNMNGNKPIDGIIVDNQLGQLQYRVPALAARIQHSLVEQLYPNETSKGIFNKFKDAFGFYTKHIQSFAFDISSLGHDPGLVEKIARSYVESGRYEKVISAYVSSDLVLYLRLHTGTDFSIQYPEKGVIDSLTQTQGCFGDYIQAVPEGDDIFGEINGKGVFLYATRSARNHLYTLLSRNGLSMADIELLIEHQANFAMIPLTLEQVFKDTGSDLKKTVIDFIANKMVNNIHERGNCSVVCMQRLPYDLEHGKLKEDTVQGVPINRNTEKLKGAKTILYDSVGAGMTRSSLIVKK